MEPRYRELAALSPHGFTKLAYAEWGPEHAERPVVCVHGLTRHARDFDALAQALAGAGRRVVAPDMPGRGRSAWLASAEDYGYPFYLAACAALIARLDAASVDWVGTSMGGLIGMMLAAQRCSPVQRLVLNDVGPFIPRAGLERLAGYVADDPRFRDLAEAEAYLRRVLRPFGGLSDADWRHLAAHGTRADPEGGLRLHHDPAVGRSLVEGPLADIDLWPLWKMVSCPTLVLRGAQSDILTAETAAQMPGSRAAGTLTRVAEIAGCGHAPALTAADQIALVQEFLSST